SNELTALRYVKRRADIAQSCNFLVSSNLQKHKPIPARFNTSFALHPTVFWIRATTVGCLRLLFRLHDPVRGKVAVPSCDKASSTKKDEGNLPPPFSYTSLRAARHRRHNR